MIRTLFRMESASHPLLLLAEETLARYDETLLRAVAGNLLKPRSHWPVEELIARSLETLQNIPAIDRRLKGLPPATRQLLNAMGHSRQAYWSVGQLLSMTAVLGHTEGLAPVLELLNSGLVHPELSANTPPLKNWESWLGTMPMAVRVFVGPAVALRAAQDTSGWPTLPGKNFEPKFLHRADGLEWPLRLGVLWQILHAGSIRLTQANALFKRDLARLQTDPLLGVAPPAPTTHLPDQGVLALYMGMALGLYENRAGELHAGAFPDNWEREGVALFADLWATLPNVSGWDPEQGYMVAEVGNAFPTIALATILLLAQQPQGTWTHPGDVATHLYTRHPSWSTQLRDRSEQGESAIEALLLGWAYHLTLVEAAQDGEGWWFRLTPLGRSLVGGPSPEASPPYPKTLVVQPNGDIVAYRQGLNVALISRLTRFADWKMIGPACTLGLTAESVYRGLETGLNLTDILATLQQNCAHPLPTNIVDLIRQWAGKRDRIVIFRAATLVEFNTVQELEAAFQRGLIAQKVTDRIGLCERELDYKHFRLLGNRDYETKPQPCVTFDSDGVTFTVDIATSDLLLEAELGRLAVRLDDPTQRRYRITPTTAKAIREEGWTVHHWDEWAFHRSGNTLPASAKLLLLGHGTARVERPIVLHLDSETLTEGVCQWPDTASLVMSRLGPQAITVEEANLPLLKQKLSEVGITLTTP